MRMMETLQASSSASVQSDAFERLDPSIRRWIYEQNWAELREVQTRAIDAILSSSSDLVIAAATAAGKTEAAFLPILNQAMADRGDGFQIVYVGPLKALINDQFLRLESLCAAVDLPVVKWHGDVQDSLKRQARERPRGVLLITPESLEALFVRRPELIKRMFATTSFVVIDELHSFLSSDRGVHLASLLKRLERSVGRRMRRVGLSATIGDLAMAARWLRPDDPASVKIIELGAIGERQLQVRSVEEPPAGLKAAKAGRKEAPNDEHTSQETALQQIAAHLTSVMRHKGNHLVFAMRRKDVEVIADTLRASCEADGVPNEFFPHHGSLARDVREDLETRLKQGNLPTTAITTATLELGVDIGSIESVAQIGAPRSIAALRQRIGRSGRRPGKPAVLRVYAREESLDQAETLLSRLRLDTVQSVAAIQLLNEGFVEPPTALSYQLSTLLHQILAVIVERGGVSFPALVETLLGPGPFAAIDVPTVRTLLNEMGSLERPLIEQASDGTLMLGPMGERLTAGYDFFAVFKTSEEYRIIAGGRPLGTVSIQNAFGPGDFLVFAGQRWKVVSVDDRTRTIEVESAPSGRVPRFDSADFGVLDDRLVATMKEVLIGDERPVFTSKMATQHLAEGRETFRTSGLERKHITFDAGSLVLFPWRGTPTLDALRLALRREGVPAASMSVSLAVPVREREKLATTLDKIAKSAPLDAEELAELDENLVRAKYDQFISRKLLRRGAARDRLNPEPVPEICKILSDDLGRL